MALYLGLSRRHGDQSVLNLLQINLLIAMADLSRLGRWRDPGPPSGPWIPHVPAS